jgi:Dyp-type peroxidase family
MELDLGDIQGNIVPGFSKDHQAFLFAAFASRDSAQTWLKMLHPEIASGEEVQRFKDLFEGIRKRRATQVVSNGTGAPGNDDRDYGALRTVSATWINVGLSFRGLQMLQRNGSLAGFPKAFREYRVPGADAGDGRGDIHALLIVAADRAGDVDAELERQRQILSAAGGSEVTAFRGDALSGPLRGREHFGFKDGISQPAVAGTGSGRGPMVAAGEFLLGYPDQLGNTNLDGLPDWARGGSYMAFLQLQQHIGAFRRFMTSGAGGPTPGGDDLGAAIVGRSAAADASPPGEHPSPFSHIGRANPDWLGPTEAGRRRLIRRAIPYGRALQEGEPDDGQRGLLFLAYHVDTPRQFEHVWGHYLNGANFPGPGAGRDPLTGQLHDVGSVGLQSHSNYSTRTAAAWRPVSITQPGQQGRVTGLGLPVFVTPRFGGYFLAPSISALAVLADGAFPPVRTTR